MKSIVLLGPPGCGKGTQAQHLCDGLEHGYLQSSALFSSSVGADGGLVDDTVMIDLVEQFLEISPHEHHVFDGFPRTVNQAKMFLGIVPDFMAINFEISREIVTQRILGRLVCGDCRKSYSSNTVSCECGGELVKRVDDNLDTALVRIDNYYQLTMPILYIPEFRERLYTIDASQNETLVESQIWRILNHELVPA